MNRHGNFYIRFYIRTY